MGSKYSQSNNEEIKEKKKYLNPTKKKITNVKQKIFL